MEEEIKEKYLKAGKILEKAIELARVNAKEGTKFLELAEEVENFIIEKKAKPAFPVNLSKNNIAAHYTPKENDNEKISKDDVVKIDIGVCVDGYIADAAFTINLSNKWKNLIHAANEALKNAIEIANVGKKISEIGRIIEETIKKHGFKPVYNLSGHGLAYFEAHTEPNIPNYDNKSTVVLEENCAYAIEPFSSNGKGFIHEGATSNIYKLIEKKPVRSAISRKILDEIEENFATLPFAERWLKDVSEFEKRRALKELIMHKCIKQFNILLEKPSTLISQAETSIIFDKSRKYILVDLDKIIED